MNRKTGIAVWLISFALAVFLLLFIPDKITDSIYAVLAFTAFAYLSKLLLWLSLFRKVRTPADAFYCSQAMTLSGIYLLIQFVFCIAAGFLYDTLSFKITVILNVILMAVMWILIISTTGIRKYAQDLDSRQKDNHIKL